MFLRRPFLWDDTSSQTPSLLTPLLHVYLYRLLSSILVSSADIRSCIVCCHTFLYHLLSYVLVWSTVIHSCIVYCHPFLYGLLSFILVSSTVIRSGIVCCHPFLYGLLSYVRRWSSRFVDPSWLWFSTFRRPRTGKRHGEMLRTSKVETAHYFEIWMFILSFITNIS